MKKSIAAAFCILFTLSYLSWQAKPDGLLHVYFLDVGQGDAILIRTPEGENILIDGGPQQKILTELKETLPLFDTALDYVMLTHPDSDHLQGLIPAMQRYPVQHVLFPAVHKDGSLAKNFLQIISEKNIPVIIADKNSDINFGSGVILDTLFPFSQLVGSHMDDANDASLVIRMIYGENEILFTGDAGIEVEKKLIEVGSTLAADILKLGHHGSKTSTSEEFLYAVTPKYGIISCGKGNKFNHPHKEIMKLLNNTGVKILRTDKHGRIEFIFDKKGIRAIKTQMQTPEEKLLTYIAAAFINPQHYFLTYFGNPCAAYSLTAYCYEKEYEKETG